MKEERVSVERQDHSRIYKNIPSSLLNELKELGILPIDLEKIDGLKLGEDVRGKIGSVEWSVKKEKDGTFAFYTGEGSETPVEILAMRLERQRGRTEEERAQDYWNERLENEKRIDSQQDLRCWLSVVVPIFNEQPERLLKQLDSFRQQNVSADEFEIIYVINNDIESGAEIREANRVLIDLLEHVSDLRIFVIDKSSEGNEILDCNVGRARNRGLAEASRRFFENEKNGLVLQIDADTYLSDPHYIKKIQKLYENNSELIGVVGNVDLVFDPDTRDAKKKILLARELHDFLLGMKKKALLRFLLNPGAENLFDFSLGGAHILSRSFESAAIGGFIDTNIGEDNQFITDLVDYAAVHSKTVIIANDLSVTAALRESDRTDASFGKDFASIILHSADVISIFDEIVILEERVLQLPRGKEFLDIVNGKIEEIEGRSFS